MRPRTPERLHCAVERAVDAMQARDKEYWKLFKPAACSVRLRSATRDEVFAELVDNFVRAKLLEPALRAAAVRALLERESVASTGVGQRVAIPHVKLVGLEEAIFSLSIHPSGIEWSSLDGEPVTILFTVLRPDRPGGRFQPERHLDMMRWISALGRDADFRRFALGVTTKKGLVDLLREKSLA
jgi:mannitol/fructose-specific phosphotransferase system IIA component (Ntr-type)